MTGIAEEHKNLNAERLAFSLDEASASTGLSKGHLRNENKRGKLRFIKSGRRTLILIHELRRYLAELSECRVQREDRED
jgi:excisionase family DNA binding protein